MLKGINWLAVLIATAAAVATGYLWFNVVFASTLRQLDPTAVVTPGLDPSMAGGVVSAFVIVTGIAWVFARTGVASIGAALATALAVCVAFDSTVYAGFAFFSHYSGKAMAFYGAADVIIYLVAGLILGVMRPRPAP